MNFYLLDEFVITVNISFHDNIILFFEASKEALLYVVQIQSTSPGTSLDLKCNGLVSDGPLDKAQLEDAMKDLSAEASMAFKAHFKLGDCDKSTEELQKRFGEILDENVLLKETLKQNNDSMKDQFLLIASCQEDMMKTHSLHKENTSDNLVQILGVVASLHDYKLERASADQVKAYSRRKVHFLNDRLRKLRRERCPVLLKRHDAKKILFTDKKYSRSKKSSTDKTIKFMPKAAKMFQLQHEIILHSKKELEPVPKQKNILDKHTGHTIYMKKEQHGCQSIDNAISRWPSDAAPTFTIIIYIYFFKNLQTPRKVIKKFCSLIMVVIFVPLKQLYVALKKLNGKTKFKKVQTACRKLKWCWTGHMLREKRVKWTEIITEWYRTLEKAEGVELYNAISLDKIQQPADKWINKTSTMSVEGVMVSYNYSDDGEHANIITVSLSGMKFSNRWVLTHGSLLSPLKQAHAIKHARGNPILKEEFYETLPEIYVTICHVWQCPILNRCVDDILYSWTIGHRDGDIEKQTQLGKALLSVFVLIDLESDDNRGFRPLRPLSELLDLVRPPPDRGSAVERHGEPYAAWSGGGPRCSSPTLRRHWAPREGPSSRKYPNKIDRTTVLVRCGNAWGAGVYLGGGYTNDDRPYDLALLYTNPENWMHLLPAVFADKPAAKVEVLGVIVSNAKTTTGACYPYINMAVPARAFVDSVQQFITDK
ncbi:hypothetical protein MSG28_008443, partial [Choristoneura fumiferana]